MSAASLETETWPEETLSSSAPIPPPVTYEDILMTTGKDNTMKELFSTIDMGFPESKPELPKHLQPYCTGESEKC